MNTRPINEDDLNGFVDERLDAARTAEVTAYLDSHPDVARRIAGYCEQRDQLRAALAPIADEPLPPELNIQRMISASRRPRRRPRWSMAAAAVFLLSVGAAGGWSFRDMGFMPRDIEAIAQEAAASYRVYAPDRVHPIEIGANDRSVLAQWSARQLGRSVAIPDLAASGYRFMGGRIVPTNHGPAALYMYDDDKGTRLVLLARPMPARKDLPMSVYSQQNVNGFAWIRNGLGYSLVGGVDAAILHPIADEVRRQLSRV